VKERSKEETFEEHNSNNNQWRMQSSFSPDWSWMRDYEKYL